MLHPLSWLLFPKLSDCRELLWIFSLSLFLIFFPIQSGFLPQIDVWSLAKVFLWDDLRPVCVEEIWKLVIMPLKWYWQWRWLSNLPCVCVRARVCVCSEGTNTAQVEIYCLLSHFWFRHHLFLSFCSWAAVSILDAALRKKKNTNTVD